MSAEMTTYACVAPSKMVAPFRVTSTSSPSFTIEWTAPTDDGGCPILSYAVFRNDGENGSITTEVNSDQDTNIRDKPTLRQMVITNYPTDARGNTFMYQIEAFNVV
jgi:hypothetical protein